MIDCHVHLLPDRLLRAVRRFFGEHITDRFAYPADPWLVLDRHAEAGFSDVWNLPYAHRPGVAHGINASMADVAEKLAGHDVTIVRGATVHPVDPDPAGDLRNAVADLGARVLKLHCSVGDYPPDHAGLDDVYETAAELEVPVVIHVGVSVDGETRESDLACFESVARRHPGTTLVVAHAGAPAQNAVFSMMERLPNVWVDLTPVVHRLVAAEPGKIAAISDRVLFGSDAPNTSMELGQLLDWFNSMGLEAEEHEAVLCGNASRLVG